MEKNDQFPTNTRRIILVYIVPTTGWITDLTAIMIYEPVRQKLLGDIHVK